MLLYFPAKPPAAPSTSATIDRVDFWSGLKRLLRYIISTLFQLHAEWSCMWCSNILALYMPVWHGWPIIENIIISVPLYWLWHEKNYLFWLMSFLLFLNWLLIFITTIWQLTLTCFLLLVQILYTNLLRNYFVSPDCLHALSTVCRVIVHIGLFFGLFYYFFCLVPCSRLN